MWKLPSTRFIISGWVLNINNDNKLQIHKGNKMIFLNFLLVLLGAKLLCELGGRVLAFHSSLLIGPMWKIKVFIFIKLHLLMSIKKFRIITFSLNLPIYFWKLQIFKVDLANSVLIKFHNLLLHCFIFLYLIPTFRQEKIMDLN